jgi:hypothetical protein
MGSELQIELIELIEKSIEIVLYFHGFGGFERLAVR